MRTSAGHGCKERASGFRWPGLLRRRSTEGPSTPTHIGTRPSVIDMTVFGKDLVLATGDGLKLIALKP